VDAPYGQQVSQNVTVQVWVCDLMMGAAGPATIPPGGSTPVAGLPQGGPLAYTDPPSPARVAIFVWTPHQNDFRNVYVNKDTGVLEAHMCIGANAYFTLPDTTNASEGAEVTAGQLNIWGDQRHAQNSIKILPSINARRAAPASIHATGDAAASSNATGEAPIGVINDGEDEEEFIITAEPLRRPLGFPELELLLTLPFVRRIGGRPFDPDKFLDGIDGVPNAPLERFAIECGGELVLGLDKTPLHRPRACRAVPELEIDGQRGECLEITLPPTEPEKGPLFITARLNFRDADDFGAVQAVDFVQRRSDGTEAGGARLVFVNVRPEDLEWGQDREAPQTA
jgi:hypothetical protein